MSEAPLIINSNYIDRISNIIKERGMLTTYANYENYWLFTVTPDGEEILTNKDLGIMRTSRNCREISIS